jgi:hypothetical protein
MNIEQTDMIIRKTSIDVVHVHDDERLWTVVQSYKSYEGVKPCYTIIREDAFASAPYVESNKSAGYVNEKFGHDVISLFNED